MIFKKISYKLKSFLNPLVRKLSGVELNFGYYLFFLICSITIIILISNIIGIIKRGYERHEIIKEEKARLENLKAENEKLQNDLKYYTSKEYIDLKAREELNLALPNQKLAMYIKPVMVEEEEKYEEIEPKDPDISLWVELIFK